MHLNSQLLFEKYFTPLFQDGMRVLEIGPDSNKPDIFRDLAGKRNLLWETIDIEKTHPGLTYVMKGEYEFSLPDNTYDIVFSSSMIEHVRKVWVWIREVARVCKPGGRVLTISPVSWPYHGVLFDCWRIYPEGMKALYEEAGLQTECSFFQSLEPGWERRGYPGMSSMPAGGVKGFVKNTVKKWVGWPSSYAVDLVTIGKK